MSCASATCSSLIIVRPPQPLWVDWPWPIWLYDIQAAWRGMHERVRQRQALLNLDDHLLADIGISCDQAFEEASNPFWR
jgi:uncharacterized protein YjiS (DUF1127 family)